MVNGIRTIARRELNKEFGSKFCVDSKVRYETLEEPRNVESIAMKTVIRIF